MELTPRSIFKGKNSDGSTFRAEEWDYGSLATFEVAAMFPSLIVASFFCSIISPIMAIFNLFTFNGGIKLGSIISVICSSLFLLDASNKSLITILHGWFISEGTMKFLVAINIVSLTVHLVLLILGLPIIKWIMRGKSNFIRRDRLIWFYVCCCLLIGCMYVFGTTKAANHGNYLTDYNVDVDEDGYSYGYDLEEEDSRFTDTND